MIVCKGMNDLSNKKVVRMCAGSLALDAYMKVLEKQGDGLHEEYTYSSYASNKSKVSFCRMHHFESLFSQRRIALQTIIVPDSKNWTATTIFVADQVFRDSVHLQAWQIIVTERLSDMFCASGPQIILGPFFAQESVLKQKLTEFLLETQGDYEQTTAKGKALSNLISQNGGVSALADNWEELMRTKVYPRLLNSLEPMNPGE